jgi:hypothetical protein
VFVVSVVSGILALPRTGQGAAGRTTMAEPHWLMIVPELEAAVAVFAPVADVSVSERKSTSMAALDLDAALDVTSPASAVPDGGVKVVVAELVPFLTPCAVSNNAPDVTGVIEGARTSG